MRILIITTWLSICFFAQVKGQQVLERKSVNDTLSLQVKAELDELTTFLNENDWMKAVKKRQFRCSFLRLNNLAKAASAILQKEAFACINSSLVYQPEQSVNREKEFVEIIEKTFGIGQITLKKA